MSEPGPLGDDNPLEGLPFFGDLAKMLQQSGPVSWDIARQVSMAVATGGASEPNVEPAVRMSLEELARVAELRVTDVTGLAVSQADRIVAVEPVTRGEWSRRTLEAYRPLLEQLAEGLAQARDRLAGEAGGGEAGGADPTEQLLGGIFKMIGPLMLGMQSGFMVGHLASRSFGSYDLPLPRGDEPVAVIPANIDAFADEWSLPLDEVRLWICVHELAHHAVLRRRPVADRITELVLEHVSAFEVDPSALEHRLAGIDPTNPAALQEALGDPEALLGAMQSDRQRALQPQLEAITCAVVGYVDWVLDTVGPTVIGSYHQLTEALRRRRVEAGPGDRFVERLFGLHLGQAQYDRGSAFVDGIVERAGPEGLQPLWSSARHLPTPAEIDAPGLWLARIELPD